MNNEGRPTRPVDAPASAPETFTGHRALQQEEPLLFEISRPAIAASICQRRR